MCDVSPKQRGTLENHGPAPPQCQVRVLQKEGGGGGGGPPGDDWDNVQRKALVKLWNGELPAVRTGATSPPRSRRRPGIHQRVRRTGGHRGQRPRQPAAEVPGDGRPHHEAGGILVDGDYKLKAPAQTEFNTMEIVGVYRLVDKVHWQLYTARKEILQRMGSSPLEGAERLEGKVLSTPRVDDEAGSARCWRSSETGVTDGFHPSGGARRRPQRGLPLHGTDPGTLPKIISGGANEQFGNLAGCSAPATTSPSSRRRPTSAPPPPPRNYCRAILSSPRLTNSTRTRAGTRRPSSARSVSARGPAPRARRAFFRCS